MEPPLVDASTSPAASSTLMPPPDVRSTAFPRLPASEILPPDVFPVTGPPMRPKLSAPPEVRAATSPIRSPTAIEPPEVLKSTPSSRGKDTRYSTCRNHSYARHLFSRHGAWLNHPQNEPHSGAAFQPSLNRPLTRMSEPTWLTSREKSRSIRSNSAR